MLSDLYFIFILFVSVAKARVFGRYDWYEWNLVMVDGQLVGGSTSFKKNKEVDHESSD